MTLPYSIDPEKQKRVQLDYALIDVDFFSKPKIKAVRVRYKLPAALWLIEMILDLSRATDAEVEEDVALAMAAALGVESPPDLLKFCLEQGILDRAESGRITQRRVREDQEKMGAARDRARDRQRRSRVGHGAVTRDSRVSHGEKARDPDTVTVTVLDHKKKNSLPLKSLDTQPVRDALARWSEYLKKYTGNPLDEIALEAILASYAGRPDDLCNDINKAAATTGRWLNLRDTSNLRNSGGSPKATQAEKPHPLANKIYKPPVEPDPTPEQKAKNLAALRALTEKTKGVA